jgi:hypothetical protein
MTDFYLNALGGAGPLAVEDSFTANFWFDGFLDSLRQQQVANYSDNGSGASCCGCLLRHRDSTLPGTTIPMGSTYKPGGGVNTANVLEATKGVGLVLRALQAVSHQ